MKLSLFTKGLATTLIAATAITAAGISPSIAATANETNQNSIHTASTLQKLSSNSSSISINYDKLITLLDAAAQFEDISLQAQILFPDNTYTRLQFIDQASSLTRYNSISPGFPPGNSSQALPAALIPYVVILGRCVAGALGGAGVNEVITLIHKGQQATAESRVYALIGGCITNVVPPFLRPLAEKLRKPLATAVLWVLVQLGPKVK